MGQGRLGVNYSFVTQVSFPDDRLISTWADCILTLANIIYSQCIRIGYFSGKRSVSISVVDYFSTEVLAILSIGSMHKKRT